MFWLRIDNRLVHGQVVETWLPYLKTQYVIVANDSVASDVLRQQIIRLALPQRVTSFFTAVEDIGKIMQKITTDKDKIFCLVENSSDARRIVELGIQINTINIGNIHYSASCYQLSNSIAATAEDLANFKYFEQQGIFLDFRCVPNDIREVKKIW